MDTTAVKHTRAIPASSECDAYSSKQPEKGLKTPVVDNKCAGIARKRMFKGHYARMYTLYTLYTLYIWKTQRQEQVGIQNIK